MNRTLKHSIACYVIRTVILLIVVLPFVLLSVPATAQNEKTILDMTLLSGSFNGSVKAGQDNIISFEIHNSGNVTLNHIVFSYLAPKDWTIVFSPDTVETLGPGSYSTIEVNIRPAVNTSIRNNNITLVAQTAETRQILDIYTQLETTIGKWLWIGIGIAVVCVGMFLYLYYRLNRGKT